MKKYTLAVMITLDATRHFMRRYATLAREEAAQSGAAPPATAPHIWQVKPFRSKAEGGTYLARMVDHVLAGNDPLFNQIEVLL